MFQKQNYKSHGVYDAQRGLDILQKTEDRTKVHNIVAVQSVEIITSSTLHIGT